nr:MAG TPA: hypothetical protein [Caudoviricetes sp.]
MGWFTRYCNTSEHNKIPQLYYAPIITNKGVK